MITVTTQEALRNAVLSSTDPEILVANNINLTSSLTVSREVTISGNEGVSLIWNIAPIATGTEMLIVAAAGNLTIKSLTLNGNGYNVTLVEVLGGSFTMDEGAVLRNVSRGTDNPQAVRVGEMGYVVGGTFTMNGGLITEINTNDAVFCNCGTIVMNNDAAISDNMATGITMSSTVITGTATRSKLTMSGTSRISNNQSKQSGAGALVLEADITMGVNPGDAPIITGNQSPYSGGGMILLQDVTLTMRYGAEISDNYAPQNCGGLWAQAGSTVSIHDNCVIRNNECDGIGGGVVLVTQGTLTMDGQSEISGNTCGIEGGGIYAQTGAILEIGGETAIYGNTAENGGGISFDQPAILNLAGQTSIRDNVAVRGKGIYKAGTINLSQSPQILDGLFFDDLSEGYAASASTQFCDAPLIKYQISPNDSEYILLEPCDMASAIKNSNTRKSQAQKSFDLTQIQPAYSDNVPIIVGTLTENAIIQLESSEYVTPSKVPLVIADKGEEYVELGETDRAAWRIPLDFEPIYTTVLNTELNQVLIVRAIYNITYYHLFGTENPNPASYDISELPTAFVNPGVRPGYTFVGWYNAAGERASAIAADTAEDLALIAVWEKSF